MNCCVRLPSGISKVLLLLASQWLVCSCQKSSNSTGVQADPSLSNSTLEVLSSRDYIADRHDQAAVRVSVRNELGEPVAAVEVRLEIVGLDVLVDRSSLLSDHEGVVEARISSGKAESKRLSVTLVSELGEFTIPTQPVLRFIADRSTLSTSDSSVSVNPTGWVRADGQSEVGLTVRVVDALGNGLSNEAVEVVVSGSGNLLNYSNQTASNGEARGTLRSLVAESKSITVIIDPAGLNAQLDSRPTVVFIGDADNLSPSLSTIVAEPPYIFVDGQEEATLIVTVRDHLGQTVPGQTVALETTGSPAHTLIQPLEATHVDGETSGRLTATEIGELSVSARVNPSSDNLLLDVPVVVSTVGHPRIDGMAFYRAGELYIPFNHSIRVQVDASPTDFNLSSPDDDLGEMIKLNTAVHNPALLRIGLFEVPKLRIRGKFDPAAPTPGSPSGIDISAVRPDIIEGLGGHDAVPSTPVDIVPGFFVTASAFSDPDSRGVAVGDLNCDGAPDAIAAANQETPNVRYINKNGTLQRDFSSGIGNSSSRSVTLADVDLDGDLDLAFANLSLLTSPPSGAANTIWRNDGKANFLHHQDLGNQISEVVQFGDLDRDGDPDLVTGNAYGQPNDVYFNDQGSFIDSGQRLGTDHTQGLVLADVNGELFLDLIEANGPTQQQTNKVRLNDGHGVFSSVSQSIDTQDLTRSISAGDIDRDGYIDLVFAGKGVQVWLNDGGGSATFSKTNATVAAELEVHTVGLNDLDSDGWPDLFLGIEEIGDQLFWNDRKGGFQGPSEQLGRGTTHAVTFGDINRDGDIDFMLAKDNIAPNRVYGSHLSAVLSWALEATPQILPNLNHGLVTADFNQDGAVDVAGGHGVLANETVGVFLNDGTGNLLQTSQPLAAPYVRDLAVADFDLDLDPDLIFATATPAGAPPSPNRVWFNDGTARFQASQQSLGDQDEAFAVKIGDLNRDGYPDLVFAELLATRIWFNDALGSGVAATFTEQPSLPPVQCLALVDLDHDCDLDLAAGHSMGGLGLTVWDNDGAGQFSMKYTDVQIQANSIRAAQLWSGGSPQLLVSATYPSAVQTTKVLDFRGNHFLERFDFARPGLTLHDLGDVDGDGDPDLLLDEAGAGWLWLNEQYADFTPFSALSLDDGRFLDLDGDTDLDIVNTVSTLLNQ